MVLKKLRCFNTGSIAAGGSKEIQFSPPEDWHVKRIYISDRNAQSLTDVLAYIRLPTTQGELPDLITDDYAPAHLFGSDKLVAIDIDRDVPKGASVYIKLTNNKSSSVNIDVCFEITA